MPGGGDVDKLLRALQHPIRRRIVRVLGEKGAMSYADLMRECGVEDSGTFAFHLRQLRGLVEKLDEGVYGLTELGQKAYRIVVALEEGRVEELEQQARAREEVEKRNIVLSGRLVAHVTRSLMEKAAREGRRIVVDACVVVVVDPVDPELFDKTVETINAAAFLYLPESLRGIADEKMNAVALVRYYSGDKPPREAFSLTKTMTMGLGDFVSKLVKATLAPLTMLGLGAPYHAELEGSYKPAPRLVLSASGADVVVRPGEPRVRASYEGFYTRPPPSRLEEVVETREGEVAMKFSGCNAEVGVASETREIKVKASGSDVTLEGVEAERVLVDASGSDVELKGVKTTETVMVASGSNVEAYMEMDGADMLLQVDASGSDVEAVVCIPPEAKVAVDGKEDIASDVTVIVDDRELRPGTREEGYENAPKKLRITLDTSASNIVIHVRRQRGGSPD